MMAADIEEINGMVTEVEEHLQRHNVPAALTKCNELKRYIQLLSGVVKAEV